MAERRHFLDTWIARLLGGVIGLAALAAIWGVYNVQMSASTQATAADNSSIGMSGATNPAFIQCRDQRTAEIDQMLSEGLINEAKHGEFTRRAVQTCAGRFPPDG